MKFTRIAPGTYVNTEGVKITRVVYPTGIRWVIVEADGTPWDPFYTLADAKAAYASI